MVPRLDFLEDRRLLASYTVTSAQDLPDADLDDGRAAAKGGEVTLQAIWMQATHDKETQLTINLSPGLNIEAYSASFTAFSVTLTGTGARIGPSIAFGPNSVVTGITFGQGLSVGNGSKVTDCDGGGLSIGSNSEARNGTFPEGIGMGSGSLVLNCVAGTPTNFRGMGAGNNNSILNVTVHGRLNLGSGNGVGNCTLGGGVDMPDAGDNTITGCTIKSFVSIGGDRNLIENNTFEGFGAVVTHGSSDNPVSFTKIVGNTFNGGSGLQLSGVQDSLIQNNVVLASEIYSLTISNDVFPAFHLIGRNKIVGNSIGIDASGQVRGSKVKGISIIGSEQDTIGGAAAGEGNVVVGSRFAGIAISSGRKFVVQGNFIGTNSAGAPGMGNGGAGVLIGGDGENTIGGPAGAGNIVAANKGVGISVSGDKNLVQGNRVGRTKEGDAPELANLGNGIVLQANDNTVGGLAEGLGNSVGGNGSATVFATGIQAFGERNLFQGNVVGTDKTGKVELGNTGGGVFLLGSSNTVGGSDAGAANVIAHNKGAGVSMGQLSEKNKVSRNSIFGNTGRGIRLTGMTTAVNDPGHYYSVAIFGRQLTKLPDLDDKGANKLPNYPVIKEFKPGGVVRGTLQSGPNKEYTLEFFTNEKPHSSGFGDGQTFAGSTTVTTDSFGYARFEIGLQGGGPDAFVSATSTDSDGNTSGFSIVDRDLDGIADAWETDGIDIDEDGEVDLELKGADPRRKTIFVEVDRMAGVEVYQNQRAREGFKPSLDLVEDAFARAPVDNLDGSKGIDLIIDVDEAGLPPAAWTSPTEAAMPTQFPSFKEAHFGTPAQRGTKAIDAKRLVYRYAVLASSLKVGTKPLGGISESPGNDFVVITPGDPSISFRALIQAGTFMHELGHTLGLRHGGGGMDDFGAGDETQYKPNYFSVMNYTWQFPGSVAGAFAKTFGIDDANKFRIAEQFYRGEHTGDPDLEEFRKFADSWELDYSRKALDTLFEGALDEGSGIGGDPNKVVVIAPILYNPLTSKYDQRPQFVPMGGPVDWNGSGHAPDLPSPFPRNLNDLIDGVGGGLPTETFKGHEDWSELRFDFRDFGQGFEEGAAYAIESNDNLSFLDPASRPATSADVSISTIGDGSSVLVGRPTTMTLTVRNQGPNAATNVSVVDTLPADVVLVDARASRGTVRIVGRAVTLLIDGLAPGAGETLTLVVRPDAAGPLRNEAVVSASESDPVDSNNRSIFDLNVQPAAAAGVAARPTTVKIGRARVQVIQLAFSTDLNAAAASNVNAYQLFAGRLVKKKLRYDKPLKLVSAVYDAAARTVTLRTRSPLNIAQAMLLRVDATAVRDLLGRPVDGDGDGLPGGVLTAEFAKKRGTILKPAGG